MKHRALSLGLACLSALAATLASVPAQAQGLRLPSGTGTLPVGSAPAGGVRAADYIVAVVNSEPITNNEVRQRAERVAQQMAGQALPPPGAMAKEVLERLIMEKVQVQLARDSGIKVDDWAVDQAAENVARQNSVSTDEMYRRLAADGISRERFREELRSQLLALRVRERDVESRVRVSELDVDQYLREQQQQAAGPAATALNLGHILIRVPEDASPVQAAEREKRARQVAEQLQAGGDFAALARQYSDAPEGSQGGALGLRPADRYPELFVSATQGTAVGGTAGPVRSAAGFHILKVLERSRAGAVPAMVVQNHARHILLRLQPGLTERQAAERLEELRDRVASGRADFAELAREYSQDGSAKNGGDLGWASPGRYVPEFEEVLNSLSPGEISQPVVSRFGVHLIQLLERREAKLTQREQRDMVRDAVREKKLDEAFANWLQEARARAYVEYREPPTL
ncbi:peptidylprolyl isomerase [Pulveribacter sp.]|uniref:peptidylprolyl isomerase n=1 Tax=Pulveribacter sp. TaxID=2678893 RepID=UPI0028AD6E09|nr:peptidylprolyl isomerase [Pulveribacter sp.]